MTYLLTLSHVWISYATHLAESCHTYEWVMSHMRMSHVSRMNESCHTWEWVMSHIWMSHVICDMTHSYVLWLIQMCDMTHSYVTILIHMCHDLFICAMTHSYVPWLLHMCHDSFICAVLEQPLMLDVHTALQHIATHCNTHIVDLVYLSRDLLLCTCDVIFHCNTL